MSRPKFRSECPDPRCRYAITTDNPVTAGIAMAEHHTKDPRHTDGEWIDRDGNRRIGLQPIEEQP